MLLSHRQNAGQNRDLKVVNRSFENVSQFSYLESTRTNQNLVEEEINSGNACYRSESFVFSSTVQKCKEQNIQDYNLALVLYGCETWSLILREEHSEGV
jgi:hypothetical protein